MPTNINSESPTGQPLPQPTRAQSFLGRIREWFRPRQTTMARLLPQSASFSSNDEFLQKLRPTVQTAISAHPYVQAYQGYQEHRKQQEVRRKSGQALLDFVPDVLPAASAQPLGYVTRVPGVTLAPSVTPSSASTNNPEVTVETPEIRTMREAFGILGSTIGGWSLSFSLTLYNHPLITATRNGITRSFSFVTRTTDGQRVLVCGSSQNTLASQTEMIPGLASASAIATNIGQRLDPSYQVQQQQKQKSIPRPLEQLPQSPPNTGSAAPERELPSRLMMHSVLRLLGTTVNGWRLSMRDDGNQHWHASPTIYAERGGTVQPFMLFGSSGAWRLTMGLPGADPREGDLFSQRFAGPAEIAAAIRARS